MKNSALVLSVAILALLCSRTARAGAQEGLQPVISAPPSVDVGRYPAFPVDFERITFLEGLDGLVPSCGNEAAPQTRPSVSSFAASVGRNKRASPAAGGADLVLAAALVNVVYTELALGLGGVQSAIELLAELAQDPALEKIYQDAELIAVRFVQEPEMSDDIRAKVVHSYANVIRLAVVESVAGHDSEPARAIVANAKRSSSTILRRFAAAQP